MAKTTKKAEHISHAECNRALGAMEDALYVINGKWKLRIIIALKTGNKRFGELQKVVTGIAAKVLSKELKDLELNGFVVRHVYDTTPVTVEYEATPYTDTLNGVIRALADWGAMHQQKVRGRLKEKKA